MKDKDSQLIYEAYSDADQDVLDVIMKVNEAERIKKGRRGVLSQSIWRVDRAHEYIPSEDHYYWNDEETAKSLISKHKIKTNYTPAQAFAERHTRDHVESYPAGTPVSLGVSPWDEQILYIHDTDWDRYSSFSIPWRPLTDIDITDRGGHMEEWLTKFVDFSSSTRARNALRGLR